MRLEHSYKEYASIVLAMHKLFLTSSFYKSMTHMEQEFLYREKMDFEAIESTAVQFGAVERCLKCRKIMFLQCSHQTSLELSTPFTPSLAAQPSSSSQPKSSSEPSSSS
ncbi:hypothetical protein CAEBREN_21406 [Caenorhabditis brenneri]|uniref:Uncharacterized protein n=1 Tax=Caenorhabditis brenneri TaxID=135651 RepID=G0P7C8_CAEBE|nr:hypothetical protein CAEBREN_21406 [Caenorhabditis brenneri]